MAQVVPTGSKTTDEGSGNKVPRYDYSISTCKFWKTSGSDNAFYCPGQMVSVEATAIFKTTTWQRCGNRCITAGCNTWTTIARKFFRYSKVLPLLGCYLYLRCYL